MTAGNKNRFSKGDFSNSVYRLWTTTQFNNDTISSQRIDDVEEASPKTGRESKNHCTVSKCENLSGRFSQGSGKKNRFTNRKETEMLLKNWN